MSTNNQLSQIDRLQKDLEKKLGWGPVGQWHSSMYEELSETIFAQEKARISVATLKRFFGVVNHEGTPSSTTLDILSHFVGYENWRNYKSSNQNSLKPNARFKLAGNTIYMVVGFLIAVFTFLLISNRLTRSVVIPEEITFSSRPVTNTYPNSVIFDFDLNNLKSDSIHIQQYWDPSKTILLKEEQSQATGIYYFPGYFRAKLLIDGTVIKEHDLFLRSNGWLGTLDYEPVPKYFNPVSNDGLILSVPDDIAKEVSGLENPIVSAYHYITDLGEVSGDDFTLKTSIKNAYDDKWAVCHHSELFIIGSTGAMIIPIAKKGCSSNLRLMLNDKFLRGKEHDLSAFGSNLDQMTELELEVKNKLVSFYISGRKVYESSYSESMGRLVGFRFKFLGLGEVQDIEVFDQANNRVSL